MIRIPSKFKGTLSKETHLVLTYSLLFRTITKMVRSEYLGYNFNISSTQLNASAYADDLILLSHKPRHLQIKIIEILQLGSYGSKYNKCAVTGATNSTKLCPIRLQNMLRDTILYNDIPIPYLPPDQPYTYLGIQLIPTLEWKDQRPLLFKNYKTKSIVLPKPLRPSGKNFISLRQLLYHSLHTHSMSLLIHQQTLTHLTNVSLHLPNKFATYRMLFYNYLKNNMA